MITFKL